MTIRTNGSISNLAGTGPATLMGQSAAKATARASYPSGVLTAGYSVNVSSLTDVATGQIDFNFSTSFANTDFVSLIGGEDINYGNRAAFVEGGGRTVSKARTVFVEGNTTAVPDGITSTSYLGDLA